MDFIDDVFTLMPIPVAVVVMFLTLAISTAFQRDANCRLPWWFVWIPFGLGMVIGIPGYLVSNLGEIVTQPVLLTAVYAVQKGGIYGATAIGLWSGRRVIPYFRRIEENWTFENKHKGDTP